MAKNVIVHNVTYNGIKVLELPLANDTGYASFYDISGATVTAEDVIGGKVAYGPDGEIVGILQNNGEISGQIANKSDTVTIPEGFVTGGSVAIKTSEQDKIVPANIRAGVTILGIEGATNVIDTSTLDGATSGDIAEGMVAFSNGQRYVGTGSYFDISETTATPEDVAEGKIFFTADGRRAVGTAVFGPRNAVLGTATIGNCVIAPEQYI